MESEEFFKRISVRSGIHGRDAVRDATGAVFEVLRARISRGLGDNIAAQLPAEVKQMWESGALEHLVRGIGGFRRMDLEEFIVRVQDSLDLEMEDAELLTMAVFKTLQEQVTPGASKKIEETLPDDLAAFWRNCRPHAPVTQTPRGERQEAEEM